MPCHKATHWALSLCALTTGIVPAAAHAFLAHAMPAVGAELAEAPRMLTLTFTEALDPTFSGVTVTDDQGKSMETEPIHFARVTITVALYPLAHGTYHVAWHVVSVDTHHTQGGFNFRVLP